MQDRLVSNVFQMQRQFFNSGHTLDVNFRLDALHKLTLFAFSICDISRRLIDGYLATANYPSARGHKIP